MGIQPIKKKSVSDEVLNQIKNQIISGEWAPGTKIPGEIELTQMFGVSRISVREAIHRLVGMGVLTVKHGEGTYVTEMLPQEYFNTLLPILMIEAASLLEILEFRAIIETQSARLAAQRAEEEDIKRMEEILKRMEQSQGDFRKFALEDLNFHTAIALATRNKVLIKVNAIIHDMLKTAMEEIVSVSGSEGGLYYHGRILEAIKRMDGKTAAEIMQAHIDVTIERIRQNQNQSQNQDQNQRKNQKK